MSPRPASYHGSDSIRRIERRAQRPHQRLRPGAAIAVFLGLTAVLLAVHLVAAQSQTSNLSPESLRRAIEAQRAAVAAAPGTASGHKDLGNLLALRGDREAAEDAYRTAIELDPGAAGAYFDLALLISQERPREAKALLETSIKLAPESAWAHYVLGTLQQRSGKRRAAISSFAAAFSLDPELALPDVNPQVIANPDATAALIRSQTMTGLQSSTPRDYTDKDRLVEILTGDAVATSSDSDDGAILGPDSSESPPTLDAELQPGARLESNSDDETASEREEEPPADAGLPQADSSAGRSIGIQDLNSAPSSNQAPPATAPPSAGRPGTRTAPGSPPRFRPGRRSSARLDLEVAPVGGALESTIRTGD